MYSNGPGLGTNHRKAWPDQFWTRGNQDEKATELAKRFVRCQCPKCAMKHDVYMLWTGRGVPRIYCVNCRPLVSGYDNAAMYEASITVSGHSKKKGRCNEGE